MCRNYNTQRTSFILNFDFDIPQTHIARLISLFVDTIPEFLITEMLLKMILFAYSRKVISGSRTVKLNEESIPMKWFSLAHRLPIKLSTIFVLVNRCLIYSKHLYLLHQIIS